MRTGSISSARACAEPVRSKIKKVDHTASPMPEIHQPARLATPAASFRYGGRHHPGIPGGFVGIRSSLRIRLDFCRKGRIAMGAGRWTWPPGETLRARLAMCGALGRASVNSDAANQRSPNDVDPFHKIPEHEERAPKKGSAQSKTASRRKVTSPAANPRNRRDLLN